MRTLRERSTVLVILALVDLFGVALAAASPGAVPLAGGLRADHAAILFAFAA